MRSALALTLICAATALRAPVAHRRLCLKALAAPSEAERRAFLAASAATLAGAAAPATASTAEPTASGVGKAVDKAVGRKILQIERLNVDSNGQGPRKLLKPRLEFSGSTVTVSNDFAPDPERSESFVQYLWIKNEDTDTIVAAKEFTNKEKGPPSLSASPVKPGSTYAPAAYHSLYGLWLGRSEIA